MTDPSKRPPSTSASASRAQQPPSRPSTPLRPSSRTSLRESSQAITPGGHSSATTSAFPLEALEPGFAELSDSMADLEANFMHLQLMHESLSRFNESFAAFLYGMNMNAFCVDFPEAPIPDSFTRAAQKGSEYTDASHPSPAAKTPAKTDYGGEETFLTTDTSFIDNPPSSRAPSKFATPAPAQRPPSGLNRRGGGRADPTTRGGRGTGIPGGRGGRGVSGPRASGIARGKPRGGR